MTSSIVMMPTASSSPASFDSGLPSICRMSEYMSLAHFLLLGVPLRYELFALLGKLFHFWSPLLFFKLFSCAEAGFSPSISTFTSFTESRNFKGQLKTGWECQGRLAVTVLPIDVGTYYQQGSCWKIAPPFCCTVLQQQPYGCDLSEIRSICHIMAKFLEP